MKLLAVIMRDVKSMNTKLITNFYKDDNQNAFDVSDSNRIMVTNKFLIICMLI